jgi:hypothetical protein
LQSAFCCAIKIAGQSKQGIETMTAIETAMYNNSFVAVEHAAKLLNADTANANLFDELRQAMDENLHDLIALERAEQAAAIANRWQIQRKRKAEFDSLVSQCCDLMQAHRLAI